MTSWPIVTVADIAARSKNAMATGPFGSSIASRFFRPFGVPIVRGSNLSTDPEIRFRDADLVFLDAEKAIEFSRSIAKQGDLIFSCWGTINQVGLLDGTSAYREYVISNKQMKLTPDRNIVLPEFLYYLFSGPEMQREILGGAVGTGVPGFNLTRLKSLKLRLPPMDEQRDIADALSSGDRLVAGLVNLISKKRKIKQGLMQELLTGRMRLPGFSRQWQTATFGDVVRIQRGSMLTRAEAGVGRVPVIAGGKTPAGYTDRPNRIGRTITISASGASAGYVAIHDGPIFASDCSTISGSRAFDLDFIYYSLLLRQDVIYQAQTGGAQPHIHARDIYPIEVRMPATVDEQKAISRVLRDADEEITALERRLESARAIKQGMMQELLTGRTRLTEEVAA
ncbi:restriction endonuclease subunit S [Schaalia naturae]|uniref:Restriction endonuclease subunit S n=1 Tax=Schaalia naturae TaxID=635203 RepID=A0ABW2SK38_9ACTO